MNTLRPAPLTAEAFAPFGDVLEVGNHPLKINAGLCDRHHDLAKIDILDGRAGISFFKAQPRALPYQFDLVERHPKGSQAFIPMSMTTFLVIVAHDQGGTPGKPRAFLTSPGQGINLHRNIWHGVLTPLAEPGLFAVVDRIGDATNLQEYTYPTPFTVEDPNQD